MENLKAWIGLVESNEIKCCTSCIWIAGDLGLHFLSAWCFQVPWESWDTCAQPQCSFQHFYDFMSHRATDTSHFVFLAKLHSTSSTFGRQSGTKVLVGKSVRKSGVDIFSGRILLDKNSIEFPYLLTTTTKVLMILPGSIIRGACLSREADQHGRKVGVRNKWIQMILNLWDTHIKL